ncbi:DIP1984 family protein [Enterococcus asini]|uniref:Septicolysin n=1 Tax=Enterococcus asini ATCC 700915 TaxID=1158606 RepID=R2S0Q1_9ENTE|nr:DIP1984 family protein [Enterococcus asini]EOH89070.1 hypothetical protein UAS_00609 [Enterococcus asini ATCC 700915]EOT55641.1 hypothetical protein I579_02004 [Enterococcus asini ATCC 700915]MCD5028936.1 DIP1984 family protein [Enterococcus asini]MDT2744389.1 DIP1984 family protein [Enterococcus asini]MDT2764756.1 DIP1984 family protein [Enterococcus asini]
MKLAEALIERRDLQNKLLELKNLMLANTLVEEGSEPDIEVADLLGQYDQASKQLEDLIVAITKRNQEVVVTVNGTTCSLQSLLAKRARLRQKYDLYTSVLEATRENRRFGRNEIRMVKTVSVKDFTEKLDELAKALRQTDGVIQQTNWLEEL